MDDEGANVHYVDARFDAVHRRIDDARHLSEREQDAAKASLDYRLMAMDHDRDLLRDGIDRLQSTVTKLVGGLTLASLLLGGIIALSIHFL